MFQVRQNGLDRLRVGDISDHPRVRTIGLSVVALVGGLVAVTLFDDLASELAQRSSF